MIVLMWKSSQAGNFVMIQLIPTISSHNLNRKTSTNSFSVSASGHRSQDGLLKFIDRRGKDLISHLSELRSENDFNRFLFSSSLEEVLGNLYDYTQDLMDLHIMSCPPRVTARGANPSSSINISARRTNFLHH
jgi:hypothetical protein